MRSDRRQRQEAAAGDGVRPAGTASCVMTWMTCTAGSSTQPAVGQSVSQHRVSGGHRCWGGCRCWQVADKLQCAARRAGQAVGVRQTGGGQLPCKAGVKFAGSRSVSGGPVRAVGAREGGSWQKGGGSIARFRRRWPMHDDAGCRRRRRAHGAVGNAELDDSAGLD